MSVERLKRWRLPLLLTLFAFLFMYAAERHADQLRQRAAAYEMAGSR
ncbi:MAG TPA: hypothetical protein VF544_01815 [Pyrinomonadaceae bacterium]